MNIGYYPQVGDGNRYVNDIMDSIIETGVKLTPVSIKNIQNRELNGIKAIDLNWFEGFSDDSLLKTTKRFLDRSKFIDYCKKNNIKIIWTVHNKIPHDIKYKKFTQILMKKLIEKSDSIVIHCHETNKVLKELSNSDFEKKVHYIPHPNYCNSYKNKKQNLRGKFKIKDDELVYLFLGQVRPYKNIELIIEAANINKDKNIKFVIAGKPVNNEYEEKIKEKIKGNENIIPILEFIEDDDIVDFINMSDIILTPYDLKSSLNSGAVILAFSYGRTVLCPNIGTLKDFNSKNFYSYDYSSKDEHLDKLIETIDFSYSQWNRDKEILKKKGLAMQKEVESNNSKAKLKVGYKKLFEELFEGKNE